MRGRNRGSLISVVAVGSVMSLLVCSFQAFAHCDTMDGPVVGDARKALKSGQVGDVLKWVKPAYEEEVKTAFKKAIQVRKSGGDAEALADQYFFETVVRVHRAGEGAPYTGLKPSGTVEPVVKLSDEALDKGSADRLITALSAELQAGVRERFRKAHEARKHANGSVEQGREYVEAYVDFTHYAEGLHKAAAGGVETHEETGKSPAKAVHPVHNH